MLRGLVLVLALLPGAATADATIGGRTVDCYCTDTSGARVELGQETCLYVDGRAFMARCDMSLNVPIWRDTGQGCVSSGLFQRLQRLQPAVEPGGIHAQI